MAGKPVTRGDMICPECHAALSCFGFLESNERLFWCARCGTAARESRTCSGQFVSVEVPLLVERCRRFEAGLAQTEETPMPCPNCSKSLAKLTDGYFHCETCGTIVAERGNGWRDVYTPKLVERCRDFEATIRIDGSPQARLERWRTLGVAESINTPEARPG